MQLPIPPKIEVTQNILNRISKIDQYRIEWQFTGKIEPEKLQSLRELATIESIGSSTRIEGSKMSDGEVESLIANLRTESFRTRDQQEVAGYAQVMKLVRKNWRKMAPTQNLILQLHRDLLEFSDKDQRHLGDWKTNSNNVATFDPDGKMIGIVFETATPFDTPTLMDNLIRWHLHYDASDDPEIHPLLRIAAFIITFLAVHPFQDGNGRLSRVLTHLLLMRAGYSFVEYSSLENVIEHSKQAYYTALHNTQTTFNRIPSGTPEETPARPYWDPWLLFFLESMQKQIDRLRERLPPLPTADDEPEPTANRVEDLSATYLPWLRKDGGAQSAAAAAPTPGLLPEDLSPLAGKVLAVLRQKQTLSVAEAVEALGANRNTLKLKFSELVERGYVKLYGKGRGAHYREAR